MHFRLQVLVVSADRACAMFDAHVCNCTLWTGAQRQFDDHVEGVDSALSAHHRALRDTDHHTARKLVKVWVMCV